MAPTAADSLVNALATAVVGFKDWALACEAIGRGRQSVILRKGGLAEGRGGFEFRHDAFFLFPTAFHEQAAKIRPAELPFLRSASAATTPAPGHCAGGSVEIRYLFRLEWARRLEDWETVARLAPFHVYREDVARERFAYADRNHRAGALLVAFGRAYRLRPPWTLADLPAFGGCKSWLELPPLPAGIALEPVLGDEEHAARGEALLKMTNDE